MTCRELVFFFFFCTAASKSWNPHGKFPFKVAESAVLRWALRVQLQLRLISNVTAAKSIKKKGGGAFLHEGLRQFYV